MDISDLPELEEGEEERVILTLDEKLIDQWGHLSELAKLHNELQRKADRMKKKHEALKTLLFEEINVRMEEEGVDVSSLFGIGVKRCGDSVVVVELIKESEECDDDEDCDCLGCRLAKAGLPPQAIEKILQVAKINQ